MTRNVLLASGSRVQKTCFCLSSCWANGVQRVVRAGHCVTITHNLVYKTQPCLVRMAEGKGTFGAVLEVHASECTSPIHVWLSSALHFYHNYKSMVFVEEIMSDRYTFTSMDNSLHAVVLTSMTINPNVFVSRFSTLLPEQRVTCPLDPSEDAASGNTAPSEWKYNVMNICSGETSSSSRAETR